ncbi:large subunit GTPase 1 homolog [Hyalella azteca]|uniref:Large subunit GTPase 1 homolog n=1 Tax=Hyalella azteca TaxID=294128 RepID=A0A8B7N3X4_HYAAZ|nr:large subunit GTPase 1 homolog [Hyalella azteca]
MAPAKQKQKCSVGRALIKQKAREKKEFFSKYKENRHVHPISAAGVHEEASLKSITQQTDLADFMSRIEIHQMNFENRQCNVKVQTVDRAAGILTESEKERINKAQKQHWHELRIPRRPAWDEMTSKEELQQAEAEAFRQWRVQLEELSSVEDITVTPYEKNPRVWQQLWRVVERSDVVVQIVDARNPLMFRCTDLEKYVKEVDPDKVNLLLVNKSDFLSEEQRQAWADYFNINNVFAVFFSALAAGNELGKELEDLSEEEDEEEESRDNVSGESSKLFEFEAPIVPVSQCDDEISLVSSEDEYESANSSLDVSDSEELNKENLAEISLNCSQSSIESEALKPPTNKQSNNTSVPSATNSIAETLDSDNVKSLTIGSTHKTAASFVTTSKLHNREELIAVLEHASPAPRLLQQHTTIGLVGYPNVGKSSTINCLMQGKRVTVSATPGKTKHFQTLFLTPELVLCDCPGLVFPGFVNTRQEMIIWGILPIDEIRRDYHSPVTLICSTLPPASLEAAYSIPLPAGDSRAPTAEELLTSYSVTRSFMSARGRPDTSRAGRAILKDFMNGRLLYCVAPPGLDQQRYHTYTVQAKCKNRVKLTPMQKMMMPETADDRDAEVQQAFGLLQQQRPAPGKRPRKTRVKKPKGYVEYTEDENGPVMVITKPWRNLEKKQKSVKKNPNTNNPYAEYLW